MTRLKKLSREQRMEHEAQTYMGHGTEYVWVEGYRKKDGTYVKGYDRRKA